MISPFPLPSKGDVFCNLLIYLVAVKSKVAELFQLHKDHCISAFIEIDQIDPRLAIRTVPLLVIFVECNLRIEESFSVMPNQFGLNRLLNSRTGCNIVLHTLQELALQKRSH